MASGDAAGLLIADREVTVFGGDGIHPRPLVFLHGSRDEAERVYAELAGACVLVCVSGNDWNGDFSPWAAPGVFRQAGDFTGGAAVYARKFEGEIVPGVLERLTFAPTGKYLAGYSMAGLFALYSWLTGTDWTGVVSCSGSVWFDGFLEWAEAQTPRATRLWLSVGDRERKTRNVRMQTVEEHTRRLAAHWQERMDVRFTLEQGGHFDDPAGRLVRGIRWCIQRDATDT